MAKRRIDAVEHQTKRVEVGNDWVELKTTMSYAEFMQCQEPENVVDKQKATIKKLLYAWSFVGEDGQPLPITPENIDDNFDAEIFIDVVMSLNDLPFLQRLSARVKADS